MYKIFTLMVMLLLGLGVWGCATVPSKKSASLPPSPEPALADVQIKELAGGWEYEEGSVTYQITLDQEGKGTYEWKDGRFQTTSLSKGVWKGTWHQTENDREGQFELQLQPDLQSATGSWWYTRIGEDLAPLEPGGNFSLQRVQPGFEEYQDLGKME